MDDLLNHAQQLANQAPTPIIQPIEGRVAYLVNQGHGTANDSTQQLAEALNQQGLETLCMVRPRDVEGGIITPESDINGVRYLYSPLPDNFVNEQTKLEASVEWLMTLLRVYRPMAVLVGLTEAGLVAWVAAKRLGLAFYGVEFGDEKNSPCKNFVFNQANYIFTLATGKEENCIERKLCNRKLLKINNDGKISQIEKKKIENVVDNIGSPNFRVINGKAFFYGMIGNFKEVICKKRSNKSLELNKIKVKSKFEEKAYGKKVFSKGIEKQEKFRNLSTEVVEWSVACGNASEVDIFLNLKSTSNHENKKSKNEALIKIEFFDSKDNILKCSNEIPISAVVGNYVYLDYKDDHYTKLTLPVSANAVRLNLTAMKWKEGKEVFISNVLYSSCFKEGVSVIVPSYLGVDTIVDCLESLALQTLPYSQFEVLVVLNGKKDGTENIIKEFLTLYPRLNVSVLHNSVIGAGAARNYGIDKAVYKYITFIDDDDFVSQKYLEGLLINCDEGSVSVSNIEDFNESEFFQSPINKQVLDRAGECVTEYSKITSAVTLNACKILPARLAKCVKYNSMLKSGEDVDYWTRLVCLFRPSFRCATASNDAVYYRRVRENSVSRQVESFDFNVKQRLEVVAELEKINPSKEMLPFIGSKVNAQLGFVNRYLDKNPEKWREFKELADKLELSSQAFQYVNEKISKTLVISYCFPPYIDTAGIVCAKRIIEANKPVDVISNTMNGVRERDDSLWKLVKPYIGRFKEIQAYPSFSNWNAIEDFCDKVQDFAEKNIAKYTEIYSRSMWPGSHFAAALLKIKYPELRWVAEFSDPLRVDVHGKERYVNMSQEWLIKNRFFSKIEERNVKYDGNSYLFYWCEMLPYIFSDNLIFTNESQRAYMLNMLRDEELKIRVGDRSLVSPHPTLPENFYNLSGYGYRLDDSIVNIGYFGSFYATRGIGDVLKAIVMLPEKAKERIKVHIFTPKPEDVSIDEDLKNNLVVNKIIPYLDFLSVSKRFDALVVNDAETKKFKWINPYLPSKLSDYQGSGADVWALYEEGSEMSKIYNEGKIKYGSTISDINSSYRILSKIMKNYMSELK